MADKIVYVVIYTNDVTDSQSIEVYSDPGRAYDALDRERSAVLSSGDYVKWIFQRGNERCHYFRTGNGYEVSVHERELL